MAKIQLKIHSPIVEDQASVSPSMAVGWVVVQPKIKFELGLEKPDPRRAVHSALTIAIAYIVGGIVPLIPYMFIPIARKAVIASVILTLIALLIFGYAKGYFTGNKPIKSALQTALIGAVASAAAFGMAKAVQGG
ncbi:hypothetical protein HYC85_023627 [Camellia sinensis]|uniref:Vacuolar iron transporter n=1 Tax=Camellia sinensis TaxID=4442 RepID=A0A7J7GJ17_CAMSI|nr:hypothetical protein HYC85_023627 [Camellia sinensis]